MKIKGMDKTKMRILQICNDYMTTMQIAKVVGIHQKTVCQYVRELGDCLLKQKGQKPWKYKRNDEKTFVPGQAYTREELWHMEQQRKADLSAPILPQGPLSFLKEYERYTPPQGRLVVEKHGGWVGRKDGGHIGCGSYAHVDMFG